MITLAPRKVRKGNGDKFSLTFESEKISDTGLIFKYPIDISGWHFTLLVHENVEYRCETEIFSVDGEIGDGRTGVVYFFVPQEYTNVKAKTYWHSILIKRPNGKESITLSAKYIIAESLNDYFSIYTK